MPQLRDDRAVGTCTVTPHSRRPSGRWQRPGPDEQRRGRAAVDGREVVDARAGGPAGSRCDDAEVGAVLQAQRGTVRAAASAAPGRTTHTGRPPGSPIAARMASIGLGRRRRASGRRRRTSRRRCPTRRCVTRLGALARRARRRTPASASASTASQVALVEPGRRHDRRGEVGVGRDDHAVAGQRLEARDARRRRGPGRAAAARHPARGCPTCTGRVIGSSTTPVDRRRRLVGPGGRRVGRVLDVVVVAERRARGRPGRAPPG